MLCSFLNIRNEFVPNFSRIRVLGKCFSCKIEVLVSWCPVDQGSRMDFCRAGTWLKHPTYGLMEPEPGFLHLC